jgi:uncharacterized protein YjiS (DUF1127 family)
MSRTSQAIHAKNQFGTECLSAPRPGRNWLVRAVDLLLTWQERAHARRALSTMPDYLLKDIGINRGAVQREVRKPFWKA